MLGALARRAEPDPSSRATKNSQTNMTQDAFLKYVNVTSILIDVALVALPMAIIYPLQMALRLRVTVMCFFLFRIMSVTPDPALKNKRMTTLIFPQRCCGRHQPINFYRRTFQGQLHSTSFPLLHLRTACPFHQHGGGVRDIFLALFAISAKWPYVC